MLEIYAKLSSFLCRAAQEEAVIPAVRRWQQRSARTAAASCGAWRLSCSARGAAVLRGWSRIEVHFYRVAKCFPQQPVLLLGKKHGDFKDCTGSGQHSSLFGRIYLQPWQLGVACFPTFRQWIKNLQDYREGRLSKYILKTTSFFFLSPQESSLALFVKNFSVGLVLVLVPQWVSSGLLSILKVNGCR